LINFLLNEQAYNCVLFFIYRQVYFYYVLRNFDKPKLHRWISRISCDTIFRRHRVSKSRNVGNLHPPAASKSDPRLLGVSFSHPLGYLAFRCSANNFVASCFSTLAPSFSRSFSSRVREYCSAPVIIFFSLKTFITLFTSSLFLQRNPCCPWVRSRRRYLRYCYHSIFVLHLVNDKDRMITIAQIASSWTHPISSGKCAMAALCAFRAKRTFFCSQSWLAA